MSLPKIVCWSSLLIWAVSVGNSFAQQQGKQPPWWLQSHRLLQTNLREIDATMDLDKYVQEVKDFGADVVLFNIGGIVANYPTKLEFHYRNPNMQGDLVGTVLDRIHDEGLRMIGRFDFSKINEQFATQHPEWLYVSEKGETVNYNGQVHTCVSGGYQQEYMFEILGEAVRRYPLDGVFFNMIGYRRNDYSGNYHGICQCDSCRNWFRDYSGLELPATQNDSPVYRKYVEFTRMMQDRQFQRVQSFLKSLRSDLAICTYTTTGVDVIRKESNSALGRGPFHDTDKAKQTLLTCGERQLANAAVHFIRIPFRHAAVSPQLTSRRLWQQMVNGAWLDFYCIGPLQRQEDRTGLDLAADIYGFHRQHSEWLADTVPAGAVGLVRQGDEEYEGILQILCENQVAFELTLPEEKRLQDFSLVIIPDAIRLNATQAAALDQYVENGGRLLLTGQIPTELRCFGTPKLVETRPAEKGSYIRIRPEDRLQLNRRVLDKLDLVFLEGDFFVYEPAADTTGWLRLIPADMFGPPEKCYYRHVSDHPALLHRKHGRGGAACFSFGIGSHYARQAHQGHAALLLGAMEQLLEFQPRLRVSASPVVEINHRADPEGRFEWVSLYNHPGQIGNALHAPLAHPAIPIRFRPQATVSTVRSLATGEFLDVLAHDDGTIEVTLPGLERHDIVLIDY